MPDSHPQSVGQIIHRTYQRLYDEHPAYFRHLEDYYRPPQKSE